MGLLGASANGFGLEYCPAVGHRGVQEDRAKQIVSTKFFSSKYAEISPRVCSGSIDSGIICNSAITHSRTLVLRDK